jgi:FAD/FMN-containing dehydrogenase
MNDTLKIMIEQKVQNETENQLQNSLPADRLEAVAGWGGSNNGMGYVYRPTTVKQLKEIFALASQNNRSIGLRGGGNSYGDAAMNDESIVLDLTRMNRILDWDPENGRIKVQPGVTLKRIWEYVVEEGWWVPVATGTAKITVGGGAAMNVHGKNAWKMGTFGEHIYEFDLLLPSGEIKTCSREQNSDLFFAAIGGFGMLGCFTSLTLHLKRIYSGLLQVEALTKPNLSSTMHWFEDHLHNSDYLVGWLDAFSRGKRLGRSELHRGIYLKPDEDPNPQQTLRLETQRISPDIFGFFPRSALWRFQRPFWNNFGMRWVNIAKFRAAKLRDGAIYREPHAHFHFLLDSLDWKKPFGPGGLIQYQPFIPKENAETAFTQILQLCQLRGLPNFLTVMKRHRPDPFWLTHALEGYSLAMDFRITKRNRARMVSLARELDEIVLLANGRFYLAKDSTLRPAVTRAYLGEETIIKFMALKQQVDPQNRLQTNLWRRLFG